MNRLVAIFLPAAAAVLVRPICGAEFSQPKPQILTAIDDSRLAALPGNTHPLARAEFDRGVAPSSLPMNRMQLVLKRSPQQETVLRQLISDQHNPSSSRFHKWLTPDDFGKQFGAADSDVQAVTTWLQGHGFHVSRGRGAIEFSGSAGQVQDVFPYRDS